MQAIQQTEAWRGGRRAAVRDTSGIQQKDINIAVRPLARRANQGSAPQAQHARKPRQSFFNAVAAVGG
eukprot:9467417-Pyramimonas_sp.AAC.1